MFSVMDATYLVRNKVSCDLCGIPIFLYPGEYPGTCGDCEEKLRDQDEVKDPCRSCGRVIEFACYCGYCMADVCYACKTQEHLDFCDSDWDDYDE